MSASPSRSAAPSRLLGSASLPISSLATLHGLGAIYYGFSNWNILPTVKHLFSMTWEVARLAVGVIKYLSLCFIVYYTALVIYRYLFHPLARFPGPPLAPANNFFWIWTLKRGRAPWTNQGWHKKYGPVVRIAENHLSFADPAAQDDIYGFGTKDMPTMLKDPYFFKPEYDGERNVLTSIDKDEHARMRRILSQAFGNSNLYKHEYVIHQEIDDFLFKLAGVREEDGKKGINIVRRFNHVTFNIIGVLSFGPSFHVQPNAPAEKHDWLTVIVRTFFLNDVIRSLSEFPFLLPLMYWWRPAWLDESSLANHRNIQAHLRERLAIADADTGQKDLVHHMLANKGQRPSFGEMACHLQAITTAGTVTTSTFLSGVIYYLCIDSMRRARLTAELRTKFARLQDITARRVAEECDYLKAVCAEGLRIYPPAGAAHLPRIVPPQGAMIAGHWVPGGTRVSVHRWTVVRDPANFHEPDSFIPERWLKDKPTGHERDRFETSMPFSHGPRGCIGRNQAVMEMHLILAKMFWLYDIEWYDESVHLERDGRGYTLWDKPDIRVLVRTREDVGAR